MRFRRLRGAHQFDRGYFRWDVNLYERTCDRHGAGGTRVINTETCPVARTDTGCAIHGQVGRVVPRDLTDRACAWPIPVLGVCVGRRL